MVESGTLCQAASCSMCAQVVHAVEKPQVGDTDARSFFAASNTPGQVFRLASSTPPFLSWSLFSHITIDDELNGNDSISPLAVE